MARALRSLGHNICLDDGPVGSVRPMTNAVVWAHPLARLVGRNVLGSKPNTATGAVDRRCRQEGKTLNVQHVTSLK